MAPARSAGPPPTLDPEALDWCFRRLFDRWGPQHWWPGETPFEIMVGAVLTQNTAWTNVERAIANLKGAGALDPGAIAAMAPERLAALLRPAGYFNVKARRLRAFCRWYLERGGFEALRAEPTERLRSALLAVHGVGPETADDILLYAFGRPVFVVDAYTKRLFARLGWISDGVGYEALRRAVERAWGPDPARFNELHALIVRHAKTTCRPHPQCADCVLARRCAFASKPEPP
jgi:endonuclease-3 related protein